MAKATLNKLQPVVTPPPPPTVTLELSLEEAQELREILGWNVNSLFGPLNAIYVALAPITSSRYKSKYTGILMRKN
jgi:hypothetical protein